MAGNWDMVRCLQPKTHIRVLEAVRDSRLRVTGLRWAIDGLIVDARSAATRLKLYGWVVDGFLSMLRRGAECPAPACQLARRRLRPLELYGVDQIVERRTLLIQIVVEATSIVVEVD